MVWTPPRTWADAEVPTEDQMQEITDTVDSIGPHIGVRSTDDTDRNTTTLAADPYLFLPIGANEIWSIWGTLWQLDGGGQFKAAWSFPSGATGRWSAAWGIQFPGGSAAAAGAADLSAEIAMAQTGIGQTMIDLLIANGSTPGDLTLMWACNTAGSCTLFRGMLYGNRIG